MENKFNAYPDIEPLFNELTQSGIEVSKDVEPWQEDCSAFSRKVLLVVSPQNHQQVLSTVQLLNKYQIPFHAVSTGKNWGYGTALPATSPSVLIYLGKMNRITRLNKDFGTVDIEPGVTQKQLADYFAELKLDFFVPTTGAGPHVSILANALERGFGISPIEDHARAIVSLKAVLANGKEYQSYFRSLDSELSQCYHWGVGPSIDGIFSQSNFGIVTEITLELIKKPELTTVFFFSVADDKAFANAVDSYRQLRQNLPGIVGTLKLFSQTQVKNTIGKPSFMTKLVQPPSDWVGFGILHSTKRQNSALKKDVKAILSKQGFKRVRFLNEKQLNLLYLLVNRTFLRYSKPLLMSLLSLKNLLDLSLGKPSDIGLKIIYPNEELEGFDNKNPAKDGLGLMWFSPITPLIGQKVSKLNALLNEIVQKEGFPQIPITFTVLTTRCMAAVVPITFDKNSGKEKARKLYLELLHGCSEQGYYPYRLPIEFMYESSRLQDGDYWENIHTVKRAFDPDALYAKGRYLPREARALATGSARRVIACL